jgi:hypothetical protein
VTGVRAENQRLSGTRDEGRAASAAWREAFVLPGIFLSVALLGGLRVSADGMRFLPPPLISLVLAMLLLGVLVQGGVLVPGRLMNAGRPALENTNGAAVLLALFFGTAQVFTSVTPEAGLLHLLFNLFFVLLLWNTLAAGPDAPRLLRSLLVVFGSAFVLKYVVLAALYDPAGGLAKRVLTTLLQGATLGALDYQPHAAATGYVGYVTSVLYIFGLLLMPKQKPATPQSDDGGADRALLVD